MTNATANTLVLTFDPAHVYAVLHQALVHYHQVRLDFLTDPFSAADESVIAYEANRHGEHPEPCVALVEDLGHGFCLLPAAFAPDHAEARKAFATDVTPGIKLAGELSDALALSVSTMVKHMRDKPESVAIRIDLDAWDIQVVSTFSTRLSYHGHVYV